MEENLISLKFLKKKTVFFSGLNNICSIENLCDVKLICNEGKCVFMHKLVLNLCFPSFFQELSEANDQLTFLIPDWDISFVENARRNLYVSGEKEQMAEIFQLRLGNNDKDMQTCDLNEQIENDMVYEDEDTDSDEEQMIKDETHTSNLKKEPEKDDKTCKMMLKEAKKDALSEMKSDTEFYFIHTSKQPSLDHGLLVTHERLVLYLYSRNSFPLMFIFQGLFIIRLAQTVAEALGTGHVA